MVLDTGFEPVTQNQSLTGFESKQKKRSYQLSVNELRLRFHFLTFGAFLAFSFVRLLVSY
jgi:hypothetical protein